MTEHILSVYGSTESIKVHVTKYNQFVREAVSVRAELIRPDKKQKLSPAGCTNITQ